jgi:non-ribosomal peptide synthase protein (TIGR01720 family)
MRDASALDDAELADAQDLLADELMDAIDLAAGRVLAAGALGLGAGRGTQIVLAVHHAVSDVVSWSVLAEDLEAGLAGGPSALRGAGTSWSWWAQALSQRVRAEEACLPYWSQAVRRAAGAAAIPVDDAARPNHEGDVRERRLCVPAEQAAQFLAGMASVYGLRAHEAVLAATGLALADWAAGALVLDLEGHGRQPFDAAIDLSRTVGWFTTRYPMVLPQGDTGQLTDWLLALKQGLREIPEHGMSYGVLRYGGHDELRIEPEVSFNFVGELGQFGGREVSLLRLGAGRERGAAADRRHLLAFDGWQDGEGLWLSCRHAARHGEATVAGLLEGIRGQVQRLAQACAATSAAVYTPADFTGMEFSQGELDQLMGELGDADDER